MGRRPTLADVAHAAGVSASTASVVFSGNAAVSDATRERVLAVAADLGYAGPDPRAASLRRGRSGIVAVVFEEHLGRAFLDPVKTLMMDGLADAVAAIGAGLLLLRDVATEGGPTLTTAPIDAAVLIGCSGELRGSLDTLHGRGTPVVVIEGDAGLGVPQIQLDNRDAQRVAAQHLRDLGHTDVAVVCLPPRTGWPSGMLTARDEESATIAVSRDRLAGARDVFPNAPAYAASGSFIDEGLAAGRVLFADVERRPTAVIAQSDLLAVGVIRAAEEAGLRVPADVSVTGFDGIAVDGIAPYVLTTLEQPAAQKGRAAGDAVLAMLDDREAKSMELTCRFRVGNTTTGRRETRP